MRLQGMLFGEPSTPSHEVKASPFPFILHLTLVLIAGLYLPPMLVTWFQRAAGYLG